MFLATLKLGIRNLLLHKLRSFLTMLGTILGVASVIAMLAVGEGSKRHAIEQIRQLGASNVIIRSVKPQERSDGTGGNDGSAARQNSRVLEYGLKYRDLRQLQASLTTVELAVPMVLMRKNAQYSGRRIGNARILGTTPEFQGIKQVEVYRGRFIDDRDVERSANVAVLGAGASRKLFGHADPLGKSLLIGTGAYRIVGVLKPRQTASSTPGGVGVADMNQDIYIPLTAARNRFGELQRIVRAGGRDYERIQLSEITLAVKDEAHVSQTAAKGLMKEAYQAKHGRDLYEAGKEIEEAYHKPVREAEIAERKADKLQARDRMQSMS